MCALYCAYLYLHLVLWPETGMIEADQQETTLDAVWKTIFKILMCKAITIGHYLLAVIIILLSIPLTDPSKLYTG